MGEYYIIWVWKPIGWTPTECVDNVRKNLNEDIKLFIKEKDDVKIAFAGRLDPMACGLLPIVVASKSDINSVCATLQNHKKIYRWGMYKNIRTDTYDILGMIVPSNDREELPTLDNIVKKKTQKYPMYSSKTIKDPNGKGKMRKLFEFANEGRTNEVKHLVPEHPIIINYIKELSPNTTPKCVLGTTPKMWVSGSDILLNVNGAINSISSSNVCRFRLDAIRESWRKNIREDQIYETGIYEAEVSSGTYIRGLADDMGGTAFGICRISMGDFNIENIDHPPTKTHFRILDIKKL
jgi:tRNA U55 pseudouridine synthase TruB